MRPRVCSSIARPRGRPRRRPTLARARSPAPEASSFPTGPGRAAVRVLGEGRRARGAAQSAGVCQRRDRRRRRVVENAARPPRFSPDASPLNDATLPFAAFLQAASRTQQGGAAASAARLRPESRRRQERARARERLRRRSRHRRRRNACISAERWRRRNSTARSPRRAGRSRISTAPSACGGQRRVHAERRRVPTIHAVATTQRRQSRSRTARAIRTARRKSPSKSTDRSTA